MQTPYRPGLRIIEDCLINLSENERGRVCTQLANPHLPRPGAGWVSLAFVYTLSHPSLPRSYAQTQCCGSVTIFYGLGSDV
jgi:hypothetical protein